MIPAWGNGFWLPYGIRLYYISTVAIIFNIHVSFPVSPPHICHRSMRLKESCCYNFVPVHWLVGRNALAQEVLLCWANACKDLNYGQKVSILYILGTWKAEFLRDLIWVVWVTIENFNFCTNKSNFSSPQDIYETAELKDNPLHFLS